MTDDGIRNVLASLARPSRKYMALDDAAKLVDDMTFDSLSFEELAIALETEFNIGGISHEEQSKWVTVRDVIDMVERKLSAEEIERAKREAGQ